MQGRYGRQRRIKNANELPRPPPPIGQPPAPARVPKEPPVADIIGKLYVENEQIDVAEGMEAGWAIKLILTVRVCSGLWTGISDCDETFNYWEPMHMLLHNEGFQTWEYSPAYALRSYLYLYLVSFPARILQFCIPIIAKVGIFFGVRIVLAFVTGFIEFYLYKVISKRLGNGIGRNYVILSLISPGMYFAASAFLPSAFSMQMNALALGLWLQNQFFLSVLFTAISALVGWPFAAVLGLPVVLEMIFVRRKFWRFVNYALISGCSVLALLAAVDTYYYGKLVITPLNIVTYNVFSSHGPDLYGVEPWSYYAKNLFLNWNFQLLTAAFAVPLSYVVYRRLYENRPENYWRRYMPLLFIAGSVALWLVIFFLQPHKEERFLFPIYPLIALLSAIGLDAIVHYEFTFHGRARYSGYIGIGIITLVFMIFFSRIFMVYNAYNAPIEGWAALTKHLSSPLAENEDVDVSQLRYAGLTRVCVGKEWHRFTSSFFIPEYAVDLNRDEKSKIELRFIQSEFKGILPKPFKKGKIPEITRAIPTEMNDQNLEEPSRYVSVDTCHYLIDLETPDVTPLEPNYVKNRDEWESIWKKHFLLQNRSPNVLFRAFYVPLLSEWESAWGTYHVLKRKATFLIK
ncbi:hypothetical protein L596_013637 [Steinernema carpocapsae]|uniref:Mannosyltransferase n=1 Tax=Steinernema carpocapsae TaxID=34508 RepID=A0A4U5P1M7_STECR|nr:hypothetical protein L596_013637 [Steinernema carpocapsae]